ncbi:23S rRNA (uracil(1939)-C(5))-methyltransferase RlmD [Gammaproteobacteria bacterium]|nr:23S rRNA (uracil(1939)-C(5))-methyltransferase RlmD [Gammaproteobacteria bacterium]
MTEHILQSEIESLSHDGRGVARVDGKVFFIEGGLQGELVRFRRGRRKRSFETGRVTEILRRSPHRVSPPCEYFGVCGGCALQHLDPIEQVAVRQQQLMDNLHRIARVSPDAWLEPLTGPTRGYRRKARLGIRFVPKKGGVLIGFRERNTSYITPLESCHVLDPRVSELLTALHLLVENLSCFDRVPQIEVAAGENEVSLVFRHLEEFTEEDLGVLRRFADQYGVQVFLQSGGLDSIYPLSPVTPVPLFYNLPKYDVRIQFETTDFVQVNADLNRALVDLVVDRLDPGPNETVLDLFCGLGNFTLPLARRARAILGVEGEPVLVDRARENARDNQISNAEFSVADLYAEDPEGTWLNRTYDKVLLDPPRTGAMEVIKRIGQLAPNRVVYVSCNPATLARDAEFMVHDLGFRLTAAGVIDMFPHTNHVESIAVFESRNSN